MTLIVLVVAAVAASPGALARPSGHGALSQLAGTDGCVSETGSGGACADGKALFVPLAIAVTADGKSTYVASALSDAVAAFARSTSTGKLSQLGGTAGCVSETGSAGACVNGKALDGAFSVAASADGKNVYVASESSDAVAVFARAATGELAQLAGTAGCVSETGTAGACLNGKALDGVRSVALSPDGKSVYVASISSDAVAVFSRHLPTGQLRQLGGPAGCASETGSAGACTDGKALDAPQSVAVSPDGKNVYVASSASDAVAAFARDALTGKLTQLSGSNGCVSETGAGPCADGKALDAVLSVAVSPDGKSVYLVGPNGDAVAVFSRNTVTGVLTQLAGTDGCVSETGTGGACIDGKALDNANAVAVSSDGKTVYIAAQASDAVAVFKRVTSTGKLSQLAGTDGCVSETGSGGACADGKALDGTLSVAVSADGKSVYASGYAALPPSDAVAIFARH